MPEFIADVAGTLAVWALPVLLAVTLHEVAHGWVARALGDPTAAEQGRLSLNPLRHVDPVGTVLVPAVLALLGGFIFGWARPVPVNMHRLPNPRRDMALVALAGPAANLAMAIGWALLLRASADAHGTLVAQMAQAGVVINLVLMVLNLLPLPPLDGGRVLNGVLPEPMARAVDRIEPFGLLIIVGLMAAGLLGVLLRPGLELAGSLVFALVGLGPGAGP